MNAPGLTHVIVGDRGIGKPFQCPAGVPIVDEDWVKACHTMGKWLPYDQWVKQPPGA